MSTQKAIVLLKENKKRITGPRVALLNFLMSHPKAYALNDIVNSLCVPVDKATIYRSLQAFEDIGLVLKMVDYKGICQYMFNQKLQNSDKTHPYLRCRSCGTIVNLPNLPEEYLAKLEHFKIEDIYFLMEGICPKCLKNAH